MSVNQGWVTGCVAMLALSAAGCSGSTKSTADAGSDGDGGEILSCQDDPRVTAYGANLHFSSSDGALNIELQQSTPAPPAQGLNSWTVRVTDASGNPQTNLTLQLVPYMPDHHHGPPVTPNISSNGDGTYSITNIDYFMPGVWQNTVMNGTSESAQIDFCVGG